jgi:type IV pilus assembly protein PilB
MGERATPAGEFFRWRPAGVGRRAVPCARCEAEAGGQARRTRVRLLENLLEALCERCGRSLALERARAVEQAEGAEELARRLVALGALDPADATPGATLQLLVERGALRRDLRLTLDLDMDSRAFSYTAAPLRDLVLPEEVERALAERRGRGGVLNELLRPRVLERLAASVRGIGLEVGLEALGDPREIDPACRRALPVRALEVYRAVPVRRAGDALVVATWDPLDEEVVSDLESIVEGPVEAILAGPEALTAALADLGVRGAAASTEDEGEVEVEGPSAEGAPLELAGDPFEQVLLEALEEGAEEVLVEPRGPTAGLRFRVRGELRDERAVAPDLAVLLAERLEELAAPADDLSPGGAATKVRTGHARCEVSGLPVALDFRVLRTPLGPAVAIELEAEGEGAPAGLSQLGLSLEALAAFEQVIARGAGLIVVAAPRRGGKTEAYHAILERARRQGGAVLSLERRPRRIVPGVTQLELDEVVARRDALLHPPPDWLGVDGPLEGAAPTALDVALAGGGAVVTVTAPDARSALLRLDRGGVPPVLVQAVLARRVVPRVCPRCRLRREPADGRLPAALLERLRPAIGLGCPACADQGTAGAVPLAELVRPGPSGDLVALPGSTTLAARALDLVAQGEVPYEHVVDLLSPHA